MISNLLEVYADKAEEQKARYAELTQNFKNYFGYDEGLEYFSAPGRSEIGGNHTDHQGGCTLAAAVNLDIIGAAKKRDDCIIELKSYEYDKSDKINSAELELVETEKEKSSSLIRGICARIKELGFEVGGFDCYTTTNVLKGSGLSSSAAFEVLVATVINHLYNDDKIDAVEIAKIAQYAENVYFGKPSGLLDQSASSIGGFTASDFRNSQSPKFKQIKFDIKKYGYNLCIVDTGGNHADLTGDYASVPLEMKQIANHFGKNILRDVSVDDFYANIIALRKNYGDRAVLRAIHFFNDNETAQLQAKTLEKGDFETFLTYVKQSGVSSYTKLQNVYSNHAVDEQGLSIGLAMAEKVLCNSGAFRVHGGGFAGTIQAYVKNEQLDEFKTELEKVFGENSCYVLSVRNVGAAKIILE